MVERIEPMRLSLDSARSHSGTVLGMTAQRGEYLSSERFDLRRRCYFGRLQPLKPGSLALAPCFSALVCLALRVYWLL